MDAITRCSITHFTITSATVMDAIIGVLNFLTHIEITSASVL